MAIHTYRFIMRTASKTLKSISEASNIIIVRKVSNFLNHSCSFSANGSQPEKCKTAVRMQKLYRYGMTKQSNFMQNISMGHYIKPSILLTKLLECGDTSNQLGSKSISGHQNFISPIALRCRSNTLRDEQSQDSENSLHPCGPINIKATTFFPKPTSYSEVIHA